MSYRKNSSISLLLMASFGGLVGFVAALIEYSIQPTIEDIPGKNELIQVTKELKRIKRSGRFLSTRYTLYFKTESNPYLGIFPPNQSIRKGIDSLKSSDLISLHVESNEFTSRIWEIERGSST